MLLVTAELPMLALIFVFAATPIPIGSSRFCKCTLLAGMTIRPRATSRRTNSGSRRSRVATNSISGVIEPFTSRFQLCHGALRWTKLIGGKQRQEFIVSLRQEMSIQR